MDVGNAVRAVKAIKPKIAYPYYYRGSDLEKFKALVATDSVVEVRIRDWYATRKDRRHLPCRANCASSRPQLIICIEPLIILGCAARIAGKETPSHGGRKS